MTTVIPILRRAKIVGNYFRNPDEKAAFAALKQGDPLTFELEPANPHDPFAVKVVTEAGVFIGYVPKEISATLYALAHLGVEAKVLGLAHGGGLFSIGVQV